MKIILNPLSVTEAICTRQKESGNKEYRITKLCVQTDCADGTLLFHTLTGMLILIENEREWDQCRQMLIENWFLVPKDFDEMAFADKVLQIARLLYSSTERKNEKKSFTILTTTDCNARCYYCYEAGIKKQYMSAKTAEDVGEYIIRASGEGEVQLRWFGGEPLLNSKAIDIICEKLKAGGKKYNSYMITNGYYFDSAIIEKAIGLWNLNNVQITLDGTAETYNRIKAYKEGGDAYTRVLRNIENACNAGIMVQIRLNVGEKNISELMLLANELAVRFPQNKNLTVYASLLGNFRGNNGRFESENQDLNSFLKFKEHLKSSGSGYIIAPLQRELKFNACDADNDSCEIILPDGKLSRCDHQLEKECYGSIYTDERDFEQLKAWKEEVKLPECFNCALYPRCLNLKKCAWVNTNCPKSLQIIRKKSLQEQIIDAYNSYRK